MRLAHGRFLSSKTMITAAGRRRLAQWRSLRPELRTQLGCQTREIGGLATGAVQALAKRASPASVRLWLGARAGSAARPASPTGEWQMPQAEQAAPWALLSLQLLCGDADVGTPLALGELKAGERYSVLLVPSVSGPRLLGATDSVSH